jgi:ribonuclease HII
MTQEPKFIIGVDEVGRGPLAGPVAVGVACVPTEFDWTQLPGVTDSKQLSENKREAIFAMAKKLQQAGKLRYEVAMVSAKVIDQIGIVTAINLAMSRALNRLEQGWQNSPFEWTILPDECVVRLDGGLRAPVRYEQQETINKGDLNVPEIGLASIVAKVTRDRYMTRLAARAAYTPYDFAAHKGYGTKAHRSAIFQYGLSDQHRTSFCRQLRVS